MLMGLAKSYDCKIIYLDMAKSLESDDWVVSLGSGMYFELAEM